MKAHVNDDYRLLAAQYLRKQLKQLGSQLDGIRSAANAESVHRARVASRRLRAALRMADGCFRKRAVERWRKEIRRVADELGAARDKDVQIACLTGLLGNLEDRAHYAGIVRLLVKLERTREAMQPQVLKALDRLQASRVLDEMDAAAKTLRSASGGAGGAESRPLFRQLGDCILDELEALLAHQDSLGRPDDQQAHHAMRIAAKHLRYTIEICKPAYQGRLDEYLAAVREVQTLLGDVHDCDVWVTQLQAFLDEERKWIVGRYGHAAPLDRLQAGLDYLRQQRRRQRGELFARLVAYWEELERQKLWACLVQTAYVPTKEARRPHSNGAAPSCGQPAEAEPADQPSSQAGSQ